MRQSFSRRIRVLPAILALTVAATATAGAVTAQSSDESFLTGKLVVQHVDGADGRSAGNIVSVETNDGRSVPVSVDHFTAVTGAVRRKAVGTDAVAAVHGATVTVRGERQGHGIKAGVVEVTSVSSASEYVPPSGPQKTAVILINFANERSRPFTPDYVRQRVFTDTDSVNAYYKEQSDNRISLTGKVRTDGDVFGWYTIETTSNADCGNSPYWKQLAREQATASGVNLDGYDRTIYVLSNTFCSAAGWSAVPATEVWLNRTIGVGTAAHELGHSFGADHANAWPCTLSGMPVTKQANQSCRIDTQTEYADRYDVMGASGWVRHMHAARKTMLGYLDAARTETVSDDTARTLYPLETPRTSGAQQLQVPLSDGKNLFVEYRQPGVVFDKFPPGNSVLGGVLVRRGVPLPRPEYPSFQVDLLNMNPHVTDDMPGYDYEIGGYALRSGHTYYDPVADKTLSVVSAGGSSASVRAFDGATAPAATVQVASGVLQVVAPAGTANNIGVSLSNGRLVVIDNAAALTPAGAACQSDEVNNVSCDATGVTSISIQLNDGDDVARNYASLPAFIGGGPGHDVLVGGSGNDTLHGHDGDDHIFGQQGGDTFDGGLGADRLHAAGDGAADSLTCGDGVDQATGEAETQIAMDCEDVNATYVSYENRYLVVRAAPGVNSNMIVNGGATQTVVDDFGGKLAAGPGCSQFSATRVICSGAMTFGSSIRLEDGNDQLQLITPAGTRANVEGGSGNDVINVADALGSDYFYGGEGVDQVNYSPRASAVRVTIDGNADDGSLATGERDNVINDIEQVLGGNGADELFAGTGLPTELFGTAGADVLFGSTAVDSFDGGDGDDTIYAFDGNAEYVGCGNGSDTTDADPTDNRVGCDVAASSSGRASVSNGVLTYVAGARVANNITVGSNKSAITISDSAASISGTAGCTGTTTVSCTGVTSVRIDAGDMNDTVNSTVTIPVRVDGREGNDTITTGSGADTLNGDDGDDTLNGGTGADALSGGAGIDHVTYASRTAAVTATTEGDANDGVAGENDNIAVDVETLTGGSGADVIAYTGDSGGGATLNGGAGNDRLWSGATYDTLNGGDGDDWLDGGRGGDTLNGGNNNDRLSAGGPGGSDVLSGGAGTDTVDYAWVALYGHRIFVSLDNQANDYEDDGGGVLAYDSVGTNNDIENIDAGPNGFGGVLIGNDLPNVIKGNHGADDIDGRGGDDILMPLPPRDSYVAGGNVHGGGGIDTVDFSNVPSTLNIDVTLDGQENDGFWSPGTAGVNGLFNVHTDVENVTGGPGNDRITGSIAASGVTGTNRLDGAGGVDVVRYENATGPVTATLGSTLPQNTGGAGSDTVLQFEQILGSPHDDVLSGGTGNDTLDGAAGNDRLTGGNGIDTVDYSSATAAVRVDLALTAQQDTLGAGSDTLATLENLTGSGFGDQLFGTSAANTITGGSGTDTIDARAQTDTIEIRDRQQDGVITCGAGTDTVRADGIYLPTGDPYDTQLDATCETSGITRTNFE